MMKNNFLKFIMFFFVSFLFLTGCKENIEEKFIDDSIAFNKSGNGIMQLSFDIRTTRIFDFDFSKASNLDVAHAQPYEEKQHLEMNILSNGQIEMSITNVDFDRKINIPTNIQPDDRPQVFKTVISNNTMSLYDKNNTLISSSHVDLPNRMDIVSKINKLGKSYSIEEINEVIATMQGQRYIPNLEEYIAKAAENNVQVLEQGDNYVTLRSSMNNITPGMNLDAVLLIDKSRNKLVGTRIYEGNKLLKTTYLGYSNGKQKHLTAIRDEETITLPSGQEANMISFSKIDNFNFNLNL